MKTKLLCSEVPRARSLRSPNNMSSYGQKSERERYGDAQFSQIAWRHTAEKVSASAKVALTFRAQRHKTPCYLVSGLSASAKKALNVIRRRAIW